jgi:shikimate kinase
LNLTIILIGPISAGKSTIAALLAEKLNVSRISLDDERWKYYDEIGYDKEAVSKAADEHGMLGVLQYWKPFEAHSVKRILEDHRNCVIDFGAGHSVYEDETLFSQVERVLAPYPNVIMLLPSPDPDESIKILNTRFEELLMREVGKADPALFEVNAQFVRHPSNYKLAKIVIYTKDKTPDDTCAEIIEKLVQ